MSESTFEVKHVKYVIKSNTSVLYFIRCSVQNFILSVKLYCEHWHSDLVILRNSRGLKNILKTLLYCTIIQGTLVDTYNLCFKDLCSKRDWSIKTLPFPYRNFLVKITSYKCLKKTGNKFSDVNPSYIKYNCGTLIMQDKPVQRGIV